MKRNKKVALATIDPGNPYRAMEIRGEVNAIAEQGTDDRMNQLAQKYLGKEKCPSRRPGEARVLYKIRPERVSTVG